MVWKRTMCGSNHRYAAFCDIEVVGKSEDVNVGDIVARGNEQNENVLFCA